MDSLEFKVKVDFVSDNTVLNLFWKENKKKCYKYLEMKSEI